MLSLASRIAGVPTKNLVHIVALDQWPVWTLEEGSGFLWKDSSAVLSADEVLEAPDELHHVMSGQHHNLGLRHARQWRGAACFLAMPHSDIWWAHATNLVKFLLRKVGFVFTQLRLVNGGSDDSVPLVCPVWRKRTQHAVPDVKLDPAGLLQHWNDDPLLACPDILARAFNFRGGLSEFSRYWLSFRQEWTASRQSVAFTGTKTTRKSET